MSQNRVAKLPLQETELAPRPASGQTLSPAAKAALAAGVPDSTARAYKTDLRDFATWCAEVGLSAFPATAETLTEYATHLAYIKHRAPSSIERVRSAIRGAHRAAGMEPPDSLGLAKVVKGYRHALSEAKDVKATPRKATATTGKALAAMIGALDRDTSAGRRDAALILVGFATAARRSELAQVDIADIAHVDDRILVHLFRRKTHNHQDVPVPRATKDPALCPVVAVVEWLEDLAAHGRTAGPLFIRINRHGTLGARFNRDGQPIGDPSGRMTAQAVSDVVAKTARKAGLPGRWVGHSGRRGFGTESRRAGHDQLRIARHGGWADNSPVLAGYIEDADQWIDNALDGVL